MSTKTSAKGGSHVPPPLTMSQLIGPLDAKPKGKGTPVPKKKSVGQQRSAFTAIVPVEEPYIDKEGYVYYKAFHCNCTKLAPLPTEPNSNFWQKKKIID